MAGNGKKYFEADTFERIRKRILMIDPVKKSRKHNARAICIYLKKKKNIYIFVKDQSYMEFFPRCISKIYWKDWMYWEIV